MSVNRLVASTVSSSGVGGSTPMKRRISSSDAAIASDEISSPGNVLTSAEGISEAM
jgi:hypothetical protein